MHIGKLFIVVLVTFIVSLIVVSLRIVSLIIVSFANVPALSGFLSGSVKKTTRFA